MAVKSLLVFCASALFIQTISGQCIGNGLNAGYLNNGLGLGLGNGLGWNNELGWNNGLGWNNEIALNNGLGWENGLGLNNGQGSVANFGAAGLNAPASGGALGVSSVSPLYPSGLAVHSNNAIGGRLDVDGVMPFVSAVALEGQVPSAGSAGVNYSCGNGNIGIERVGANGLGYGAGLGSVGLGYGTGLGNGYGLGGALGGIRTPCGCGVY